MSNKEYNYEEKAFETKEKVMSKKEISDSNFEYVVNFKSNYEKLFSVRQNNLFGKLGSGIPVFGTILFIMLPLGLSIFLAFHFFEFSTDERIALGFGILLSYLFSFFLLNIYFPKYKTKLTDNYIYVFNDNTKIPYDCEYLAFKFEGNDLHIKFTPISYIYVCNLSNEEIVKIKEIFHKKKISKLEVVKKISDKKEYNYEEKAFEKK